MTCYIALADIAAQALRFHDPYVRLFGDRDQIVDDIASHESAITPVIRQADVMHATAIEIERWHAAGHERARLDRSTRGADRDPLPVRHFHFAGQLGRGPC